SKMCSSDIPASLAALIAAATAAANVALSMILSCALISALLDGVNLSPLGRFGAGNPGTLPGSSGTVPVGLLLIQGPLDHQPDGHGRHVLVGQLDVPGLVGFERLRGQDGEPAVKLSRDLDVRPGGHDVGSKGVES